MTGLTYMGQGFYSGTRWNPGGNNRPGCSIQTQQSSPLSLAFASDCSYFNEYSVQWGQITWDKVP